MQLIIDTNWITGFLNSDFFTGLATILTGIAALHVYREQKREKVIKASRIILAEIRKAEKEYKLIKEDGKIFQQPIGNIRSVMPQNSWKMYNHLLADKLDKEEIDSINEFFENCESLQRVIDKINNQIPLAIAEKSKLYQAKLADMAQKYSKEISLSSEIFDLPPEYLEEREKLSRLMYAESKVFIPEHPQLTFQQILNRIYLISGTTAHRKLKEISLI